MEKQKIKNLIRKLKELQPNEAFLKQVREELQLHIKRTPSVRMPADFRLFYQRSFKSMFLNTKTMVPLILILALITGTGGTAYASQNSLPGETLYPVKLTTENVQLAIASVNSEVQANIRLEIAQKRVEEIQKVLADSSQKGLSEKQTEALTRALDNFDSQLDKISAKAAEMKLKEEFQKALKLNTDLSAASEIFKEILSGVEGKSIEKINKKIEKSIEHALKVKEDSEDEEEEISEKEDKIIDVEGLKKNAQRWIDLATEEIKASEKIIKENPSGIKQEKLDEFVKKLEEAKKDLSKAITFFGKGDFREAFDKARDAQKEAVKIGLFVKIAPKGIIDKKENGDDDDENNDDNDLATSTMRIEKKEKNNGNGKFKETEIEIENED